MSILEIELTPDMAKRLNEKAKQRGLAAKAYAQIVMLQDLLAEDSLKQPKRSIMELEGLGAELWRDEKGTLLDAQGYVNALRCGLG